MTSFKNIFAVAIAAFVLLGTQIARADDNANFTVGVAGYDLVSYQTNEKPLRGNGHHAVNHEGVSYLFSTAANREAFLADPVKYLPAYGGHCAFAASLGKKFYGDPEVWRVVDGRLFLNLDTKIQDRWLAEVNDMIKVADANWVKIKDVPASEL